jgi:hypothetical protein
MSHSLILECGWGCTGLKILTSNYYYYYSSAALCWALAVFVSFFILFTIGRTPWTGDQPVAKPPPTHRTTQTRNKRTDIHTFSGIRTHDPCVRPSEESSCLRPCGHCERLSPRMHYESNIKLNACPSLLYYLEDLVMFLDRTSTVTGYHNTGKPWDTCLPKMMNSNPTSHWWNLPSPYYPQTSGSPSDCTFPAHLTIGFIRTEIDLLMYLSTFNEN